MGLQREKRDRRDNKGVVVGDEGRAGDRKEPMGGQDRNSANSEGRERNR